MGGGVRLRAPSSTHNTMWACAQAEKPRKGSWRLPVLLPAAEPVFLSLSLEFLGPVMSDFSCGHPLLTKQASSSPAQTPSSVEACLPENMAAIG